MEMFKIKNPNKRIFWIIGFIFLVGLAGCAPGTPEIEPPFTETEV
jgi:hypothetical protein